MKSSERTNITAKTRMVCSEDSHTLPDYLLGGMDQSGLDRANADHSDGKTAIAFGG